MNQPLLDLWGIPAEAAMGKDFYDLGDSPELAETLQRQIQEVFKTKETLTGETPYTSPTGVQGVYEYIFSPAFDADGSVEFVGVRKRLADQQQLLDRYKGLLT